jgi:hypothetical protein
VGVLGPDATDRGRAHVPEEEIRTEILGETGKVERVTVVVRATA